MLRPKACRLPAVVPHSVAVWDEPVVELPREPRSDDRAYVTVLTDVQDAGAGSILRTGPKPAAVGSCNMGEEALPEREP